MQNMFRSRMCASICTAKRSPAPNSKLLSRSTSSQEAKDSSTDVEVFAASSPQSSAFLLKLLQHTVPESKTDIVQSPRKKTTLEQDEELRSKLEARSGGGGEAGLELEDGKPVAMKRGVKENLFRVI